MAEPSSENTPLLASSSSSAAIPPKPTRNVSFKPETTISPSRTTAGSTARIGSQSTRPAPVANPTYSSPYYGPPGQPMLSALNSKLRRRNSHGSPLAAPPMLPPVPKIGPQRTSRNAQKLKLLPNPDVGEDGQEEESGRDVYSQFTKLKDPVSRRDAARLGKADRAKLPRVTAYCTANAYRLEGLMKFLKGRSKTRGAAPKQFDECIYSPFDYARAKANKKAAASALKAAANNEPGSNNLLDTDDFPSPDGHPLERRHSDSVLEVEDQMHQRRGDLLDLQGQTVDDMAALENGSTSVTHPPPPNPPEPEEPNPDFDTQIHTPEVFLFEYGTVVIWGMTLAQEQRFLRDIAKFETEKLGEDDVQTENFNFYYTREYQARIYNDFISLREKKNYMTKLAISHALAQSVKTSLFEDLLSTTIMVTTPLPALLAATGSISLSRLQINKRIGELFILRINIHLQGSVLDKPELMWAEPQLEPVYGAVRSYLEMDQRVGLLMERLEVLGDLLAVLKDQVRTSHGETLEWIVIILIAAEILVAAVNILVDLYAGVEE
ncbi:hypothetical protein MMC25_008321 [Agyrium rufum]|nr:hypothetical protein [Agyrium rufum]